MGARRQGSVPKHRRPTASLYLALFAACCVSAVQAHVRLLFPPSDSPFDGLDNLRTTDACGHIRSGGIDSYHFRNYAPLNVGTAKLVAGSTLNVSWVHPLPHMGGWKADLYKPTPNGTLEQVYAWNNESHWGCSADGTQTWAELKLPSTPCEGCSLRLARQKREDVYGTNYYYFSCAPVDIVAGNASSAGATCQGCNNHGQCVQGKCQCDYSATLGYWSGQYCETENECDSSRDCGEFGLCTQIPSFAAPKRECWCQKGYFGDVVVTPGGGVRRVCNRPTKLSLDDANNWDKAYKGNKYSSLNQTLSVWWKVDEAAGQIEFAVSAKTKSWVGMGYRAVKNASAPVVLPDPAKKPAPQSNLTRPGSCGAGFPDFPVDFKGPVLLDEGTEVPPGVLTKLSHNRRLHQASGAAGYWTTEGLLNTSFGSGKCANFLVNVDAPNNSHPMVSEDITIAQVIDKRFFRVMDYFTIGRSTPRPDQFYGGKDNILDAIAEETDDGVTRFKFRRPLESDDPRDYCILKDINYQMIYAYGLDGAKPFHVAKSALELGTASRPDFYKDDVIMYHGGGTANGTGVLFEGRGILGTSVDFYADASASQCKPSTLAGYNCMFEVMRGEYWMHFTLSDTALRIAAESNGKGWVGVGWSAKAREMIGSTAVIGWAGANGGNSSNSIGRYALTGKQPQLIVPSQAFTTRDESVEEIQKDGSTHTILRFTRPIDSSFPRNKQYEMIASYHASEDFLIQHTNRAPFSINFANPGSAGTQTARLDMRLVKTHAALMFSAFGVLLPAGIILARYFKDIGRNWYIFHAAVQLTGLIVAIAGFSIAMSQFNSPKDIAHFRIGIAVVVAAIVQPFTSIPRLCMHHDFVMRGYVWLAIHWTLGRAVILFGWVNIFLGIARYRDRFLAPHWPEYAFGIYIGCLFLVGLVLEARLGRKVTQKQRLREDQLDKRIADLEGLIEKQRKEAGLEDSDEDDLLGGHGNVTGTNLTRASSLSDEMMRGKERVYRSNSFDSTSALSPPHSRSTGQPGFDSGPLTNGSTTHARTPASQI